MNYVLHGWDKHGEEGHGGGEGGHGRHGDYLTSYFCMFKVQFEFAALFKEKRALCVPVKNPGKNGKKIRFIPGKKSVSFRLKIRYTGNLFFFRFVPGFCLTV